MMKTALLMGMVILLASPIKLPRSIKDHYTFVPSGTVTVDQQEYSVQSFYMSKYEVTNKHYKDFLDWIEEHGTEEEKAVARVRNENWTKKGEVKQDKYRANYSTHPGYQIYPVVNVSHQGAQLYCKWLETKLNEIMDETIKVRLPTREEFIRAGTEKGEDQIYAWGDEYLREPKGDFRANCLVVRQHQITRDDSGNVTVNKPFQLDGGKVGFVDLIAPSNSYKSYSYGFHNLNGNVAEMIDKPGVAVGGSYNDFGHDIRLQSSQEYKGSARNVGFRPVFTVISD